MDKIKDLMHFLPSQSENSEMENRFWKNFPEICPVRHRVVKYERKIKSKEIRQSHVILI